MHLSYMIMALVTHTSYHNVVNDCHSLNLRHLVLPLFTGPCPSCEIKTPSRLLLPSRTDGESQIVRYGTGEEFSWHYDEVPNLSNANGYQRVGTLLLYLSTVHEGRGGGTVFRDLNLREERRDF